MARLRIIPRDERFFDLFEEAAEVVVTGANALRQMLDDFEHAEQYRRQIHDLEHKGDTVIHAVVEKLNRTFVTPIDAEDIRVIANGLDDVIDCTQAAAERLLLYSIVTPHPAARELASVLIHAAQVVQHVVALLRDFSNRKAILELCIEINRLENAGDRIYREALGEMFRQGDLMELMRWKEIFEQIEEGIDRCEDLADAIESLVIKHS